MNKVVLQNNFWLLTKPERNSEFFYHERITLHGSYNTTHKACFICIVHFHPNIVSHPTVPNYTQSGIIKYFN